MTRVESGNPYTHEEHTRECWSATEMGWEAIKCNWCGSAKKRAYAYDGTKGLFCNKECWKSYYC